MSLFAELKRRRVFRLAAAYLVVAWMIVQVIGEIKEPLNLPGWFHTVVIVFLALMFPIALMLSWAYDVSPAGVVRDNGTDSRLASIDYGKIALGAVLVLGAFLAGNYITQWTGPSAVAPGRTASMPLRRFRFSVTGPFDNRQLVSTAIAITPDGQTVVYRIGGVGEGQLVSRSLDQLEFQLIPGTEHARARFVMSPDGRWLAFQDNADELLKKVPLDGGPPLEIVDPGGVIFDLAWEPEGRIIYGTATGGLKSVPDTGGDAVVLFEPPEGETYKHPTVVPGTDLMLVSTGERGLTSNNDDELAFLLPGGEVRRTGIAGSSPTVTSDGRLVYFNRNVLWATAIDAAGPAIIPDSVAIASDVEYAFQAVYAMSIEGDLVYRIPRSRIGRQIVIVDRDGNEELLPIPPGVYGDLSPAPNGQRIAVVKTSDAVPDLWLYSADGSVSIRITSEDSVERGPTWSPDGRYLYFSSGRVDELYRYDVDLMAQPERVTDLSLIVQPRSVSPDGATVFVTVTSAAGSPAGANLAKIDVDSNLNYLLQTPSTDYFPTISPDGEFLAYQSDRLGRNEIFVGRLPNLSTTDKRVSIGGGTQPAWSSDGNELFFWGETNIMSARLIPGDEIRFEPPAALFSHQYYNPNNYASYVLPPDRFLFTRNLTGNAETTNEFIFVQNWPALID